MYMLTCRPSARSRPSSAHTCEVNAKRNPSDNNTVKLTSPSSVLPTFRRPSSMKTLTHIRSESSNPFQCLLSVTTNEVRAAACFVRMPKQIDPWMSHSTFPPSPLIWYRPCIFCKGPAVPRVKRKGMPCSFPTASVKSTAWVK